MNPWPLPSRRDLLRTLGAATSAALAWAAGRIAPATAATPPPPAPKSTSDPHALHNLPPQLRMGSEQIAILVYPEFTALDALGPHYALAGMMGATVRFVAASLDPVPCEGARKGGFHVHPQLTFDTCPENLDLLLVPGGLTGTLAALEDRRLLAFLRRQADSARLVGSVCTGSLILAAAGLLRGRQATSHWQLLDALPAGGAKPVSRRIVFDGTDRVTAAGVSAGIDLGLELVRRYRGDFYAQGMQLLGEYDPQPPFPKGGNPATAERPVVNMLQALHAPLVPRFQECIRNALSTLPPITPGKAR